MSDNKFHTDNFHVERAMLEFLEAEVTERIKHVPIELKINGRPVDITGAEYTEEGIFLSVDQLPREHRAVPRRCP